jgi:hypothetical protein
VVYLRAVASRTSVLDTLQDDPLLRALGQFSGVLESVATVSKTPLIVERSVSAGATIIPASAWYDQGDARVADNVTRIARRLFCVTDVARSVETFISSGSKRVCVHTSFSPSDRAC